MIGNYLQQTTSAEVIFQMHFFLGALRVKIVIHVSLCMQGKFSCFCCRLLNLKKFYIIGTTIRVSSGLDPDQDHQNIGPDLGSNYLQSLSADNKSHH